MGACEYSMADYEEDWGVHDEEPGDDDILPGHCEFCKYPIDASGECNCKIPRGSA